VPPVKIDLKGKNRKIGWSSKTINLASPNVGRKLGGHGRKVSIYLDRFYGPQLRATTKKKVQNLKGLWSKEVRGRPPPERKGGGKAV